MFHLVVISSCLLAGVYAQPPTPDGRIVGGHTVNITEYPYQLSLQYKGRHKCGASILSEKWAVTAAHCTNPFKASKLSVRANSSFPQYGGEIINVKTVHQHPNFNPKTFDYDISILELDSELNYGSGIAPIALPNLNQDLPVGRKADVTGWGRLAENGTFATQLQAVEIMIVSKTDCASSYEGFPITDRMVCAGDTDDLKDSCEGDSGGPLVVDNQLIGIVSFGYGCARPEYPGAYANVANLREFITGVTGI